jgi:HK97 family phage portal protein
VAVVQSEGELVAAHKSAPSIMRGVTLNSGEHADYATLYRTQPNVRLVNGFLARNIAQLGLHAFETLESDERRRLDRGHGLSRLIRRPNPYVTRYAWTDALIHDLGIFDRFYALKVRNQASGELRLFRIPPYMVTPVGDNWIVPDGYEVKGSKTKLELERDQVFDVHGYNPSDSRLGLSPLESLRRVLAEEAAAGEWREQYWRGAARISGIIERPETAPRWSDPARTRFRAEWQNLYAGGGALAGATPILEEGMTWKDASFSPKDSEYLGSRRLSREETAAAYFISPLFVGILDHANFANVAEQHKHLYQDTLGPRLVQLEEEWELQILPEFPDLDLDRTYLEHNLAEKLKGTFEEQATVLQTMVGAPIMSRNEGRARLNLPRIAGGDDLVTPLNVLIGGQASPRDSAPGLANRGRPLKALDRPRARELGQGRKAVEDLPADVTGWHAKHVEVLGAFFDRQKAAVVSRLGAGQDVDDAWDDDRWDGELETDLFALAATMADEVGADTADHYGGTYDGDLALDYLRTNARIAAENVNATTKAAVADALADARGFASRSKAGIVDTEPDEELDPLEAVGAVFAFALAARAAQIATTRVTAIGNFGRHEAARQSGLTRKVWRINSTQPRSGHPSDGETVDVDATFSNGARWPGDASAGIDQTAGCTCSLEFTTEDR